MEKQNSLFGVEIVKDRETLVNESLTGKPYENHRDIMEFKENNRVKKCCDKWYKINDEFETIGDNRCPKCKKLIVWTNGNEEDFLMKKKDMVIDLDFLKEHKDNLKEWIFKEDIKGRLREKIWDKIKDYGIEKWFKLMKFPIEEDSIWKNRYTGHETTLGEEISKYNHYDYVEKQHNRVGTIETKGFTLWESWLPIKVWDDEHLMDEYKVGTYAYRKKLLDKEENKKKEEKKKIAKEKKAWKFTEICDGETNYVTYVNFESDSDRGFDFCNTKKLLSGCWKKRWIKKEEFVKKLVCVVSYIQKGLEGVVNDYEEEFKTEDEVKDFINNELKNNKFAIEKNKEHIYFDTRRYFWKYKDKEFENLGWSPEKEEEKEKPKREDFRENKGLIDWDDKKNLQPTLEEDIKITSSHLKVILKEKYGYPVMIRVLKDEK